jgi:hypothetical protein
MTEQLRRARRYLYVVGSLAGFLLASGASLNWR